MKPSTNQKSLFGARNRPKLLEFSWITSPNWEVRKRGIRLASDPKKVYAYVVYGSPLPKSMTEAEKEKLTEYKDVSGNVYWLCGFGDFDLSSALRLQPIQQSPVKHNLVLNRGYADLKPLELGLKEIVDIIKNGRTIIYTGAGLSVAAGIPDMDKMREQLGLNSYQSVDEFTRMLMFKPEELKGKLQKLQAPFFGAPTLAHLALAEIQKLTGVRIVTENLDMLGEAAGQDLITRDNIDKTFSNKELGDIDYIITVGLGTDDSNLLWRFKQVSPTGCIVAVNIIPPTYLDTTDYYLEGNAQEIIPKLEELLKT